MQSRAGVSAIASGLSGFLGGSIAPLVWHWRRSLVWPAFPPSSRSRRQPLPPLLRRALPTFGSTSSPRAIDSAPSLLLSSPPQCFSELYDGQPPLLLPSICKNGPRLFHPSASLVAGELGQCRAAREQKKGLTSGIHSSVGWLWMTCGFP